MVNNSFCSFVVFSIWKSHLAYIHKIPRKGSIFFAIMQIKSHDNIKFVVSLSIRIPFGYHSVTTLNITAGGHPD